MQDVAQLIVEQFLDHVDIRWFGTFGMNRRAIVHGVPDFVKRGGFHELRLVAFIPRTACVDFAVIALSRRIVEELVDETGGRSNFSDRERRLPILTNAAANALYA